MAKSSKTSAGDQREVREDDIVIPDTESEPTS